MHYWLWHQSSCIHSQGKYSWQLDGVFCQTNQLLLGGGLGINEGFVHIDACPNLSQLVDKCLLVSHSFYDSHLFLGILRKILQASWDKHPEFLISPLKLLDFNPLRVVCNMDIRPYKVLVQLISKANSDVLCCRYHNYRRQQNLTVITVIVESK